MRLRPSDRIDDRGGSESAEATERAFACLTRFGQRVRELPAEAVRAAGTNTLRRAKNRASFLTRARQALGHPIEVIAGRDEARLIYLGVAHSVPHDDGRRLVVDIGGGSTECTLGEGFEPIATESLFMGCVSHTRRFFTDGAERSRDISPSGWRMAHSMPERRLPMRSRVGSVSAAAHWSHLGDSP
jgi:exopolyphosphatase/guanosine-5'-triphosphate,3'-diphosphate pyrophosphatase